MSIDKIGDQKLWGSRLFKFKSHPHGDFGVWHLPNLHYAKRVQKAPEALRHLGFWGWHPLRMHNLVAEVGFFIALHQIIVVVRRNRRLLLQLLALGTALAKNTTLWCFLLRYPLPPPLRCRKSWKRFKSHRSKKKNQPDWVVFVFLVAEVGFEPHDLRVMSPTSYQAALLRDIDFFQPPVVPVTGIEPVRYFRITGF